MLKSRDEEKKRRKKGYQIQSNFISLGTSFTLRHSISCTQFKSSFIILVGHIKSSFVSQSCRCIKCVSQSNLIFVHIRNVDMSLGIGQQLLHLNSLISSFPASQSCSFLPPLLLNFIPHPFCSSSYFPGNHKYSIILHHSWTRVLNPF